MQSLFLIESAFTKHSPKIGVRSTFCNCFFIGYGVMGGSVVVVFLLCFDFLEMTAHRGRLLS